MDRQWSLGIVLTDDAGEEHVYGTSMYCDLDTPGGKRAMVFEVKDLADEFFKEKKGLTDNSWTD